MQTLIGVVQQQQQHIQQNVVVNKGQRSGIIKFKKLAPPSFEGCSDPLKAKQWLQEIEMAFSTMRVTDVEKVTYATYMLIEEAYD